MRFPRSRLKSLPVPLRWVLAVILILNSAFVPPVLAQAPMNHGHIAVAHGTPMYCHHHDVSSSPEQAKHRHDGCPCCTGGYGCQCVCVVTLALPITVPDFRLRMPQVLAGRLSAPALMVAPLHRLIRPPIV